MNQTITIELNKQQKTRLSRIALRYGLSLPELGQRVLSELEETFPQESFEDYENPIALKKSLKRALKDFEAGRFTTSL